MQIRHLFATSLAAILGITACGGGGDDSFNKASTYTKGVFQPPSGFANRCETPRSGTDPITHVAYPDTKGSSTDENNWLRSWTNDLYLWYSEVPDLDPSKYGTADYLDQLKTSATTATGAAKDKFHFTETTADWETAP